MNFDGVPYEMREYVAWTCWKYETLAEGAKPTKVPYNPKISRHASSNDRNTWVSFDEAVTGAQAGGYDGIGFFFSKLDPYSGIDLDDPGDDVETLMRQKEIYKLFADSYAELSPSGRGLHIIVKGHVPAGRKRSHVEIYSELRFFTFTGNHYQGVFKPIVDKNDVLRGVWEQLTPQAQETHFIGEFIEKSDDATVWKTASEARNGDLFVRLWNGDWTGYTSNSDGSGSSEADFALVDILAYYTQNRIQLHRMFEASALGARPKYAAASPGRREYLIGRMVTKSFDRMLPPVDLTRLMDNIEAARVAVPSAVHTLGSSAPAHNPSPTSPAAGEADPQPPRLATYEGFDLDLWRREPPSFQRNLIGAIADFIFKQAPRPVYEIALAGALGLMSGICGRSYNVSGTGLNQYLMLLAPTGRGKEAMSSGVDKIINAIVQNHAHEAARHVIGPADVASGQGLLKYISATKPPCFVSVSGEIGLRLQQLSSPNASSSEAVLRRLLLDLFAKSGAASTLQPTVYSDKANNTDAVKAPSFTWLGESVPSEFYKAFDETAVSGGLLPRFTCIEYNGPRVERNRNAEFATPDAGLIAELDKLIKTISGRSAMENVRGHEAITVPFNSAEAEAEADRIDKYCDRKMNSSAQDAIIQLWNRTHIKTLKIAALLAIANNWQSPSITVYDIHWAASLVFADTVRMVSKFEKGEMGGVAEVTEQESRILHVVKTYFAADVHKFKDKEYIYRTNGLIAYSTISQNCLGVSCFKRSKNATMALKQALEVLENKELIRKADKALRDKVGAQTAVLYVPV